MKKDKYLVIDLESTGLNPTFGDRITCICAKTSGGKEFKQTGNHKIKNDELELLSDFDDWLELNSKLDHKIITKNGKMFDIPFLLTRMHYLSIDFWNIFNLIKCKQFDLQEITKKRVSLDDMATILGFNNKIGSGLDAINWWKKRCYKKLRDYCWQDVLLTEKIYLRVMENKK